MDYSLLFEIWSSVSSFAQTPEGSAGLAGVGSMATVGGGFRFWQTRRARNLPALPSHQEALNVDSTPASRFLAAVHDLTMTVTEAWNAAQLRDGRSVEEVIRKHHLEDASDRVEAGAQELLGYLQPQVDAQKPLRFAIRGLEELWSHRSKHNYRTETYTVTRRDSEGRSRTETRTRQVYVDSDHYFEYRRANLAPARTHGRAWTEYVQQAAFTSLQLDTRRVELENLNSAERSFLERMVKTTITRKDESIGDVELEQFANQWLVGSRLQADVDRFAKAALRTAPLMEGAVLATQQQQERHHFRTRSKTHPGPLGFRTVQSLLGNLRDATSAWADVLGVLDAARGTAAKLQDWAEDPSSIESDMQYAELAVDVYQQVFPDSSLKLDRLPHWSTTAVVTGCTGLVATIGTWVLHPYGVLFG